MANKSDKDFVRKHYAAFSTNQPEKGFEYGVDSVENDKELKAFYAGVGYGKHQYQEPLGFEHEDHRKAFERGVAARNRHLTAYQGPRKKNFWHKLEAWLGAKRRAAVKRWAERKRILVKTVNKYINGYNKSVRRVRNNATKAYKAHKVDRARKKAAKNVLKEFRSSHRRNKKAQKAHY